jgi:hypothetical protein
MVLYKNETTFHFKSGSFFLPSSPGALELTEGKCSHGAFVGTTQPALVVGRGGKDQEAERIDRMRTIFPHIPNVSFPFNSTCNLWT